jgi:hypothetical protein
MPVRYKDREWIVPVLDEDGFNTAIRRQERTLDMHIVVSSLCGYSECDSMACDTCPWDKDSTAKSYLSDLGIKEEDYG